MIRPALILCCLFAAGWVSAHQADNHSAVAVNAPLMDFVPPAAGSYVLQRIMPAPDGMVLDTHGKARALSTFTRGHITLLGFIYTTCIDPTGCPLAYEVFNTLKIKILSSPAAAGKVQFVSLSFDPLRDTPDVMKNYAGSHLNKRDGLPWYFLTTRSPKELLPLVEGFGQDVRVSIDKKDGRVVRELSHVLKVFLIDKTGTVREIYSSSFLMPQMVMNDIETLLLEEKAVAR
ncbi:MAG: SCO family protein [Burkholderiales bacterium]